MPQLRWKKTIHHFHCISCHRNIAGKFIRMFNYVRFASNTMNARLRFSHIHYNFLRFSNGHTKDLLQNLSCFVPFSGPRLSLYISGFTINIHRLRLMKTYFR